MRLRTIHPKFLDAKGLVALRRETLLAKHVLLGNTIGYRNHPQLIRFKAQKGNAIQLLDIYLKYIFVEAKGRGYHFDETKFGKKFSKKTIPVTEGQIAYERQHLIRKLKVRDPKKYQELRHQSPSTHPIFTSIPGGKEEWERGGKITIFNN